MEDPLLNEAGQRLFMLYIIAYDRAITVAQARNEKLNDEEFQMLKKASQNTTLRELISLINLYDNEVLIRIER